MKLLIINKLYKSSLMNKFLISLFLLAFIQVSQVQAQVSEDNSGITVRALLYDYQTFNGGEFGAFNSYHHGFELGYLKKIQDRVYLSVPLRLGVIQQVNDLPDLNRLTAGLDARIHYHLTPNQKPIVPHILGGVGYNYERGGESNLQIPVGFGLNFRLHDRAFLTWQSEFRFALADDRNNFQHGIGLTYFLGPEDEKEKEEEEEKIPLKDDEEAEEIAGELDTDQDGIIDELDLCPQEAGLESLDGCPDTDEDGIADYKDLCPEIFGTLALKGCPDTDGDGVSDVDDECPNMPGSVNNSGCPDNDADSDGIPNDLDRCPTVAGPASNGGCPETDTDGDGTPDNVDECPNSLGPKNTLGCPDQDEDGIRDIDDRCPSVPGSVTNNGCPDEDVDSDGDGVPDNIDKCPNRAGLSIYAGCPDTDGDGIDDSRDACPNEAGIASNRGCPQAEEPAREALRDIDTDGDGVFDAQDRCPGRPGLAIYDGCPDTDGDGLDDSRDRCPNSAGPVDTQGCPQVSASDRRLLQIAMRSVQYETASSSIKSESFNILRQIAQIMERYPDFDLTIEGHTDNQGGADDNLRLSKERAKACFTFLLNSGVEAGRMTHTGFGEARPIASNESISGRTLNRRVEFALIPRQ